MDELIIYLLIGAGAFFIGTASTYSLYKNRVIEVLDYLTKVGKKLDSEEYDYYLDKFVKKKQPTLVKLINKKREKKEEKIEGI